MISEVNIRELVCKEGLVAILTSDTYFVMPDFGRTRKVRVHSAYCRHIICGDASATPLSMPQRSTAVFDE